MAHVKLLCNIGHKSQTYCIDYVQVFTELLHIRDCDGIYYNDEMLHREGPT